MVLIDLLLVLAMMFFLFLPITDRKTVRMKLCVLGVLVALFAAAVTRTHGPDTRLAGLISPR